MIAGSGGGCLATQASVAIDARGEALDVVSADGAVYSSGVAHARDRGRILAIKWGMNPNSSSLGVDVTFLLFGAAAVAMATPLVGAWLRWRRPVAEAGPVVDTAPVAPRDDADR